MKTFIRLGSTFFKVVGLFVKTDPNLILFSSFSGKHYNDSPRVIYEYLKSLPNSNQFRCIWVFDNPDRFDEFPFEKVKLDSWQYFITTLKARCWVTNVNIERGMKYKKSKTLYLNTWHGQAIKYIGRAVKGRRDFQWDHIDCFCISGNYERPIIERDLGVKSESLLVSGLPRNDILYHVTPEMIQSLREKYEIPEGKKVILYAPTWREGTHGRESKDLQLPIDMKKWSRMLGDEYVIFVRAHINTEKVLGIEYDDVIRNGSDIADANDLLILSDFLISDYSSIMIDYSILTKPILCFGYDYENYKNTRGCYFDLEKGMPSGVLYTEDEVINYILNCDYKKECDKVRVFRDAHIESNGDATRICVDKILEHFKAEN